MVSEYGLQKLFFYIVQAHKLASYNTARDFNIIEMMDFKSSLSKLLDSVLGSVNTDSFKLKKQTNLDTDGRLYHYVPHYEKLELIRECTTETLSPTILTDMINEGKLHKLTREENLALSKFIFPQN